MKDHLSLLKLTLALHIVASQRIVCLHGNPLELDTDIIFTFTLALIPILRLFSLAGVSVRKVVAMLPYFFDRCRSSSGSLLTRYCEDRYVNYIQRSNLHPSSNSIVSLFKLDRVSDTTVRYRILKHQTSQLKNRRSLEQLLTFYWHLRLVYQI
jgi:hypothetical protein